MHDIYTPSKLDVFEERAAVTTPEEWRKIIQSGFNSYKKLLRKNRKQGDGISAFDLTDAMTKRRQKALMNTMEEVYRRYRSPEGCQPALGEAWRDLNLSFLSYSHLDANSHILFAASIWILDQVMELENWREIYRFLPTDESILDEVCVLDVWDTLYDYELISSVEYVLRFRNPIEYDGSDCDRSLTSDLLARGAKGNDQNRENYDKLIALIPQDAIARAVEHFKEYFWEWVDRYFAAAELFMDAQTAQDKKIRDDQITFNEIVDELRAVIAKAKKLPKQPKAKAGSPLLMNSPPISPDQIMPSFGNPGRTGLSMLGLAGSTTEHGKALEGALKLSRRLDTLFDSIDEGIEKANEINADFKFFAMRMSRQGRIMQSGQTAFGDIQLKPMEPMKIANPYEICFALLYLIEADDDLPWLYGAGCGLMAEVIETLPWGIIEYDDYDDETSDDMEDAPLPKSIVLPDFLARNYRMKGDEFDFPRNLAQIVYEETGCVLPRELQIPSGSVKTLGKYGIRGKDAATVLMLMSTLASARVPSKALNLNGDISFLYDDEDGDDNNPGDTHVRSHNETPVDVNALKDEINKLKTALHSAEKESRDAKKALTGLKASAERDRRELADLREYVFHNAEPFEAEKQEDGEFDESQWPYEVKRDTVVFGGHATWAKGIRSLLAGNIRFIDKDLLFDTGIVRHADVLWIQPNALSHPMYWRIVDTARTYGKPIRYFSYASWAKCAEQVVAGDA